jgi:uncharacterized protein YcfL
MKKCFLLLFFAVSIVLLNGCNKEYEDKRVSLDSDVKSSDAVNNYLTRPVYAAFSLLAGHGIDLKDVKVFRNNSDFIEIQVTGYNRAIYTKRFDYKVDWLDKNGATVDSKAAVWMPVSAKSRTTFYFKAVAPSKEVTDFRMDTRKTPE